MKVQVTTKRFKVSQRFYNHLNFHLQTISKQLPHLKSDLPHLNILIKKAAHRYFPKKLPHLFTSYSEKKPDLALFEGLMTLSLPRKTLIVRFQGKTVKECLDYGYHGLKRELKKYKDLHFKSESQYPDHRSIRNVS